MNTLKRNYDLVVTAGTAGLFLAIGVPWALWAAWGALLTYQVSNRIVHARRTKPDRRNLT